MFYHLYHSTIKDNKEKTNTFLHVTLYAYFQLDSIQKNIPVACAVIYGNLKAMTSHLSGRT